MTRRSLELCTLLSLLVAGCGETDPVPQVTLEPVLTLEMSDTPELPDYTASVAASPDRFLVAPRSRPASLLEFDRDGRFVGTRLGRGEGPGELGTVLDLRWEDGVWIVVGDAGVARYDSDLAHLGSEPPDPLSDGASVESDVGRWVAEFHEYDIWLEDGDVHITEAPDWWEPADAPPELEQMMDLSPAILDLGIGSGGALWVVAGVPVPDPDLLERIEAGETVDVTELAEHVIRIHDPDTGELLAERRFDWLPLSFMGPGLAWAAVPDGDAVAIRIYEP